MQCLHYQLNPSRDPLSLGCKAEGKANFAVNTNPNSAVIIRIDDRDFGPVQTDAGGKASVPIVAPPGQPDATLIVITNEQRKEELLDLPNPKKRPTPQYRPDTQKCRQMGPQMTHMSQPPKASPIRKYIKLSSSAGYMWYCSVRRDGYYSVDYTPPLLNKEKRTAFSLSWKILWNITDSESIAVLPVLPSTISLAAETVLQRMFPASVNDAGKRQRREGTGRSKPNRCSNGAKLVKSPVSLGSGDYTLKLANE